MFESQDLSGFLNLEMQCWAPLIEKHLWKKVVLASPSFNHQIPDLWRQKSSSSVRQRSKIALEWFIKGRLSSDGSESKTCSQLRVCCLVAQRLSTTLPKEDAFQLFKAILRHRSFCLTIRIPEPCIGSLQFCFTRGLRSNRWSYITWNGKGRGLDGNCGTERSKRLWSEVAWFKT